MFLHLPHHTKRSFPPEYPYSQTYTPTHTLQAPSRAMTPVRRDTRPAAIHAARPSRAARPPLRTPRTTHADPRAASPRLTVGRGRVAAFPARSPLPRPSSSTPYIYSCVWRAYITVGCLFLLFLLCFCFTFSSPYIHPHSIRNGLHY